MENLFFLASVPTCLILGCCVCIYISNVNRCEQDLNNGTQKVHLVSVVDRPNYCRPNKTILLYIVSCKLFNCRPNLIRLQVPGRVDMSAKTKYFKVTNLVTSNPKCLAYFSEILNNNFNILVRSFSFIK